MHKEILNISIECKKQLLPKDKDRKHYNYNSDYDNMTKVFFDLSESFYKRDVVFIYKLKGVEFMTSSLELGAFLENFYNLVLFSIDKKIEKNELNFSFQEYNSLSVFKKVKNNRYSFSFEDRMLPEFTVVDAIVSILDLRLILITFYHRVIYLAKNLCPYISKSELFIVWQSDMNFLFTNYY